MTADDFTTEQKRYLEGFVSGMNVGRTARTGVAPAQGQPLGEPVEPSGPDAVHLKAMAATEAAGGKLVKEEEAKREEHPFDMYARMKDAAAAGDFPKGVDVFRWKFHGLFYVAPAEDSFMCRLRIPNGILKSWQFRGLATLSAQCGDGDLQLTTRANLQIRNIGPSHGIEVLETIQDLGLTARGSGADNIRNVTGSPLAGIDDRELLDTRPYAKDWHHHILNDRSLYGLPRKFNVAFDGGGVSAVLEDTNDIAFQAVRVMEGAEVPAGVYFRLALGGITGHGDFARDTGVILKPSEATRVADAIIRVFIDHGDRTDRNKARMKYVLDAWGFDKYLAAVEEKLGEPLIRVASQHVEPRRVYERTAHLGAHPQAGGDCFYLGVSVPVGKLTGPQAERIADLAERLGDGEVRLTVWQNLLLAGLSAEGVETARRDLSEVGLLTEVSEVRAGLVACTGNTGCRFAASNTKGHALEIADYLDQQVTLDGPLNIHLTGCHHSCAQHYIGDIGLLACKVDLDPDNEESDEEVEGYHLYVSGGYGPEAAIAQELRRDVPAEDCGPLLTRLLKGYLRDRKGAEETFLSFSRRTPLSTLQSYLDEAH